MDMNKTLAAALVVAGIALGSTMAPAHAASLTAQSVGVNLAYDASAYEINGTVTWTFDRAEAETYYTNAWNGGTVEVTTGTGAAQPTPDAPAPSGVALQNFVQQQRCTFFSGGFLTGITYTQTVNGTKGWKWTYTYNIGPIQPSVDAGTAWRSEETGGTVDVAFAGFVASESFLQNGSAHKYSFTLLDNGLSRVSGVSAQLQKLDADGNWVAVGDPLDLNNLDTDADLVNDSMEVTGATVDFQYAGNGGVFGKSSVYGALHAPGYKSANWVSAILNGTSDGGVYVDNFRGNNNDLLAGNVHQAAFDGAFPGLTDGGDYRTVVAGTIKGNGGSASQAFSISENNLVIGGCSAQ